MHCAFASGRQKTSFHGAVSVMATMEDRGDQKGRGDKILYEDG